MGVAPPPPAPVVRAVVAMQPVPARHAAFSRRHPWGPVAGLRRCGLPRLARTPRPGPRWHPLRPRRGMPAEEPGRRWALLLRRSPLGCRPRGCFNFFFFLSALSSVSLPFSPLMLALWLSFFFARWPCVGASVQAGDDRSSCSTCTVCVARTPVWSCLYSSRPPSLDSRLRLSSSRARADRRTGRVDC